MSAASKRRSRRRSKGVSLHGGGMTMSIIELMHQIVNEPSPRLPAGKFSVEAEEFVNGCLEKEPDVRRTPKQLFVSGSPSIISLSLRIQQDYAWITSSRKNGVDMRAWTATF